MATDLMGELSGVVDCLSGGPERGDDVLAACLKEKGSLGGSLPDLGCSAVAGVGLN